MRALVCSDSFKGTLSAIEVAAAIGGAIEAAGGEAAATPAVSLASGGTREYHQRP